MLYTMYYPSPLGRMLLAADGEGLVGAWFEGQKYYGSALEDDVLQEKNDILRRAEQWLDLYFSGTEPDFTPAIHLTGSDFRKQVWKLLLEIPYGKTRTYGDIAEQIAAENGRKSMSAQAVGGAVGHNPVSIIIPCHRVVGAKGSLTGYAGGLDRKAKLLEWEQTEHDRSS